jgi:hypothetical protein
MEEDSPDFCVLVFAATNISILIAPHRVTTVTGLRLTYLAVSHLASFPDCPNGNDQMESWLNGSMRNREPSSEWRALYEGKHWQL